MVSILRGRKRINIPKATDRIFPQDRIQIIGSDTGLETFGAALTRPSDSLPDDWAEGEMVMRRLPLDEHSEFTGKALKDSGLRNKYHCLVVGVEKPDGSLHAPNAAATLEAGDTIWLVGEHKDLEVLL